MAGNMAEGLRGERGVEVGGIKNLAVYPALLGELNTEHLLKKEVVSWWMASHAI